MPCKPVCVVPWVHSATTTTGFRTLCCVSSGRYDYATLREWWNSAELKAHRLTMLTGEFPNECYGCKNNFRSTPLNETYNKKYEHLIGVIEDHTKEDGETDLKPLDYDYRTNACNLACRTCNERASSKILAMKREADPTFILKTGSLFGKDLESEVEDMAQNAESIYFSGGEPMLFLYHDRLIQRLIDLGRTHVKLRYTSNFCVPHKRFTQVINMLEPFKNVWLSASCDGMGEIGEYIRRGYTDKVFEENMRYAQGRGREVSLTFTLTSLGIVSLPDVILFCLLRDIRFQGQLAVLPTSDYMNYRLMPLTLIKGVFASIQKVVSKERSLRLYESIESFRHLVEVQYGTGVSWQGTDYYNNPASVSDKLILKYKGVFNT